MRRVGPLVFLVSCHLADPPEPPKCDAGFHPEMGRCVESVEKEIVARLRPGCTVTPEPFKVQVNTDFQFKNEDTEPHVVTAIGGKLTIGLQPGELSQYTQVAKTGTYPYEVSGCPTGGTIAVE